MMTCHAVFFVYLYSVRRGSIVAVDEIQDKLNCHYKTRTEQRSGSRKSLYSKNKKQKTKTKNVICTILVR